MAARKIDIIVHKCRGNVWMFEAQSARAKRWSATHPAESFAATTDMLAAGFTLQDADSHVIAFPKRTPAPTPKRTDEMTDAELYAHYKKTAPADDVRFFLRTSQTLSADSRRELEVLLLETKRTELYRRYRSIQDTWRRESNEREREERGEVRARKARIVAYLEMRKQRQPVAA